MDRYLIDSNAVSHYLSELLPSKGMAFMDIVINEVPNISVWLYAEVGKLRHLTQLLPALPS